MLQTAANEYIIPALETGIQKGVSAVIVTAGKAVKATAAGVVDGARRSLKEGADYIKKDPKNLPHLVYGPGAPPKTVGLAEFAYDKFKVLANETTQTVVDSLPSVEQVAETGVQVLKTAAALLAIGTVTYIAYSKYKAAAAIKTATTTDGIKDIILTPRARIAVKRSAVLQS